MQRKEAEERGLGSLRHGEGDIPYNQARAKEQQADEHADSTSSLGLEGLKEHAK